METNVRIQGELQVQIMSALWKIDHGTVEQVRTALPPRYRSAYTTVQTVLNRLASRGMLVRKKSGNAIVYEPAFSEAEYIARAVEQTLATASVEARSAVLAQLIGDLTDDSVEALMQRADEIANKRANRDR
ncbi:MAG: BlaI/MecI/CopY family transcriptional regulator [Solirubrobacterales bacterium]